MPLNAVSMEKISTLLDSIQLSCQAFYYVEFGGDWGVELPESEVAAFHYIKAGKASFRTDPGGWSMLAEGDLLFLPGGCRHTLGARPEAIYTPLVELPSRCVEKPGTMIQVYPGGPPSATLLCGMFSVKNASGRSFFQSLPANLTYRHSKPDEYGSAISVLMQKASQEAGQETDCSRLILDRLLDLIFRLILRDWLEALPPYRLVALCALNKPGLAEAVQAILDRPFFGWDLDNLARLAHLSRSAFAATFREELGLTPLRFVKECRLDQASEYAARPEELKQILADNGLSHPHFFREMRKREKQTRAASSRGQVDGRDQCALPVALG